LSLEEIFYAKGHKNIKATHSSTLEITKENYITNKADCVIAVSSDKGLVDLSGKIKKRIRNDNSNVKLILEIGELRQIIKGHGNSKLTLTNPNEMVCRKSSYICNRTLMIKCDKAAKDLDPNFIKILSDDKVKIKIKLFVD
jgi:hypothetical protein